jgi:diguanylate cyclase (GGDEF)-like protein
MEPDPLHGRVEPLSLLDPAWVRRSLVALLVAGGALGLLWIALAGADAAANVAVYATVALVFALAAWIRVDTGRHSRVVLTVVVLACGAGITVEIALAGPTSSPFPLFYIWLLPWSFLLWDLRRAFAYVSVIAIAYGALLVGTADTLADFARTTGPAWIIGMGGVGAIGWVLRAVCDRLLDRHRAAARAAHNQSLLTEFARSALAELDIDRSLGSDAATVVRRALGADGVLIFRVVDGDLVLTGRAGECGTAGAVFEAPIEAGGEPLGLVRACRADRPFDEHELVFTRGVADVLGLATARASAERRRREQAGRDTLTELPGRERFAEYLAPALRRGGTLLLLDLDAFGIVNETLGPRAGDILLRSVAGRLRLAVGASATLARVGGDEFAVFDATAGGDMAAMALVADLQRAIAAPFDIGDAQHHLSASIGIVPCAPGAYADERAALRDAHVALRRAKELGRGRHEIFDQGLRESLERRRSVEQELRQALRQREFRLQFQPIVDLERDRIIGAETLVRWQHPTRGLVGPCEFIEVAESSDLIVPLGAWILREALRQLKAWEETLPELDDFRLGINISGRQLADPNFPDFVRRLVRMHELDPRRIVFELTETALVDESPQVERAVAALRELGIQLSLDDFGSGYASLSYVRRFAFNSLKLDRSFVADLGGPDADDALITAAISLGRAMGMNVVAEGVETAEQAEALRDMGCRLAQGFLFARPMDAMTLSTLVQTAGQISRR